MASNLTSHGRMQNRAYAIATGNTTNPKEIYDVQELVEGVFTFKQKGVLHCTVDTREDYRRGKGGDCDSERFCGVCKHAFSLVTCFEFDRIAASQLRQEAGQERASASIAQKAAARRLYQDAADADGGCGWGADAWKQAQGQQSSSGRLERAA